MDEMPQRMSHDPVAAGAAATLGLVQATVLGRPARGPAALGRAVTDEGRRRAGETLELACLATKALARLVAGRVPGGPGGR